MLLVALPARADIVIKLGTMAPNGSTWHTLLKEMGQKWQEASGGQVKLRIYPGGVVGNEGDMVKKMRIGQLQGAALTTVGMHEITPEPQTVDMPMLIDSWATLDYVMERMSPSFERSLADKGYIVLNWSEVGFVRFFSSKKWQSFGEMAARAKVFCWEGDPASAEAWRAGGFHPVVASSTDIIPSLQTGLLDTVTTAPLYAFTTRIFERAKYMVDVPWAVLTGATVVKQDAWEKIPLDVRQKLGIIAREYAKRIGVEVRRMDSDALKTMKSQGLEVIHFDESEFRKAAAGSNTVVRGKVVPAATYDEVVKLAKEAHQKH